MKEEYSIVNCVYDFPFPLRLDLFLKERLSYSRSFVTSSIKTGNVEVNNKLCLQPSKILNNSDIIDIKIPILINQDNTISPEDIPLDIVFEDDDFALINKQCGLAVHLGAGLKNGTLINALQFRYGNALGNLRGEEELGLVHRLDKDTSGLILVAKNNISQENLMLQIANRTCTRKYLAICHGVAVPSSGTIECRLMRDERNFKKYKAIKINPDSEDSIELEGGKSKLAITHYQTLETYYNGACSLIEFSLETGRTHQIRSHCEYIKHHIIGDPVYGIKNNPFTKNKEVIELLNSFKRQALHAYKIGFKSISGTDIEFKIDLPADMKDLILKLKKLT